jgi:nicotinamide-nucleotide adenylyltransferase
MLLADTGIQVIKPKFLERERYNATRIRNLMIEDQNWQSFVPPIVANVIKKINGINRLKTITKSDTKPTEY